MKRMLALLFLALLIVGCGQEGVVTPGVAEKQERLQIPAGTQVKLVLLRQLESGKSKQDDNVPFAVAADVKDAQGRVLIPKGSYATASVVASRGEGAISAAILNEPARLSIKFEKLYLSDGRTFSLAANRDKPDEPLQLTRDNTSPDSNDGPDVEALVKGEAQKAALETLTQSFEEGRLEIPADRQAELEALLQSARLPATDELIKQGKLGDALSMIDRLKDAKTIDLLVSGASPATIGLALEAVSEMAKLGGRGVDYLKGRFKGRNIRALPGSEFEAVVTG